MTSLALENPSRLYIEDAMAVWSEATTKEVKQGRKDEAMNMQKG